MMFSYSPFMSYRCAISSFRFQVGISFSVNFQLDQIQNGRLSAIINFDMPDTGQTVPDT